jgi:hypothetical protein
MTITVKSIPTHFDCCDCGGIGGYPASTYDPTDPGWQACYHCSGATRNCSHAQTPA